MFGTPSSEPDFSCRTRSAVWQYASLSYRVQLRDLLIRLFASGTQETEQLAACLQPATYSLCVEWDIKHSENLMLFIVSKYTGNRMH